jgi:hypothetical protein
MGIKKTKLEDFLSSKGLFEKPWEYDFKNEILEKAIDFYHGISECYDKNDIAAEKIKEYLIKNSTKRFWENELAIKRWIQYIESLDEENPIKVFYMGKIYCFGNLEFDYDSSDGTFGLTNDIYDRLWGWHFRGAKLKNVPDDLKKKLGWQADDLEVGSDTMNSFATTYVQAIRIEAKDQGLAENDPLVLCAVNSNSELKKYAHLTHTIGNFTLLANPNKSEYKRGFNVGRYAPTKDYWDLSLMLIWKNVRYEEFKSYIDTFCMKHYVDDEYVIKPLFARHKKYLDEQQIPVDKTELLPHTKCELNEFLKNVNCLIRGRGKEIVAKLNEEAEKRNYI